MCLNTVPSYERKHGYKNSYEWGDLVSFLFLSFFFSFLFPFLVLPFPLPSSPFSNPNAELGLFNIVECADNYYCTVPIETISDTRL